MNRKKLTKSAFTASWVADGREIAGRAVKADPTGEWGDGVWWCDCFGVCSPIVASIGGPMGHRDHK